MNIRKKLLSAVALVLFASLAGFAAKWLSVMHDARPEVSLPPAKEELFKIAERFIADSAMQVSGIIRLYDGASPATSKEMQSFFFQKKGGSFYSRLAYMETWSDGEMVVQVDSVNKTLVVSRLTEEMKKSVTGVFMPVDKFFSDTALFRITGEVNMEGKDRKVVLKSDFTPEIKSSGLIYDPISYRLKQSEIAWWKDPSAALTDSTGIDKLWLTKIEYRFQEAVPLDYTEKIAAIVTLKEGRLQPTDKYKKYQIYNNF